MFRLCFSIKTSLPAAKSAILLIYIKRCGGGCRGDEAKLLTLSCAKYGWMRKLSNHLGVWSSELQPVSQAHGNNSAFSVIKSL